MTYTEIEARADELIASWINGNRTDVLDEITELDPGGHETYDERLAELGDRVALAAQVVYFAQFQTADPHLAEDFAACLKRRAEEVSHG